MLKKVFSSSVNDQIGGLGDTLFLHPTAPYWYLYALLFIFLVTPIFSSVKATRVGLIIALAAKILILTGGTSIYAVSTVLSNEIWFILGMSICALDVQLKGRRVQGTICGLLFMILSVVVYMMDIHSKMVSFTLGLLACIAIVLLMHTLFAAPLRSILIKVVIENAVIHIVLGLGISFVGPIIAAWIMEKTKWLEFFLYPNKFLGWYKRK